MEGRDLVVRAFLVLTLCGAFSQLLGQGLETAPGTAPSCEALSLDGGAGHRSLQQLYERSALVVDVVVESVFSTTEVNQPPRVRTDSLLQINRLLKGTESARRIVVSQLGGTLNGRCTYSAYDPEGQMKPGQRYILFINPATSEDLSLLPARDVPRYSATRGVVLIKDQVATIGMSPALRDFSGKNVAELSSAIEAVRDASKK